MSGMDHDPQRHQTNQESQLCGPSKVGSPSLLGHNSPTPKPAPQAPQTLLTSASRTQPFPALSSPSPSPREHSVKASPENPTKTEGSSPLKASQPHFSKPQTRVVSPGVNVEGAPLSEKVSAAGWPLWSWGHWGRHSSCSLGSSTWL